MKPERNNRPKSILSDKIAETLTVKPRADIEDDQVFGTKPQTVSHVEFSSSESNEEVAISDFRKRNVGLLSEISKKYVGHVVNQKDPISYTSEESSSEDSDIYSKSTELNTSKNNNLARNTSKENSKLFSSLKFSKAKNISNSEEQLLSELDDTDDEDESDDYDITRSQKTSDNDEASTGDSEEGGGYDISQMDQPVVENFKHLKKQNDTEEVKKGAGVKNQLLLWEGLLEMRIHLQRCINTANQMPMPDTYEDLKQTEEFFEECNKTKLNVTNVLDKFLMLQKILLSNYPETKTISLKTHATEPKEETNSKSDEEIPSDTDNEEIPSDTDAEETLEQESCKKKYSKSFLQTKKRKLQDYESELETVHKSFKSFRDSTIQKWNDKTRITTSANIKNAPPNTILQQISYILSDRSKLIKRTQLKRSEYDIVGYKSKCSEEDHKDQNEVEINPVTRDRKDNDVYIPEIFDDSDFYHQLLRELIECKSADISDPVQLSRQWIALQQMRSKMKRKVDTKATKGRKIKYVVHNKLVNFMAPVKGTTWTDESTNELYSSLFGKMFENNKMSFTMDLENDKS